MTGNANAAGAVATKRTAFHAIGQTQNRVDSLVSRVIELANELVGGVPLDKLPENPQQPGLLGSVLAGCECTDQKIAAAHAALDRIKGEMP